MNSIRKYILVIGFTAIGIVSIPEINAQNYGNERRLVMRTARPTTRKVEFVDRDLNSITSLPKDCKLKTIQGNQYINCGKTYYKPYYRGTQLVYRIVVP